MSLIQVDLLEIDQRFAILTCPNCGMTQNLDLVVDGNWDCADCDGVFWVSRARVVSVDEPNWKHAELELIDDNGALE